MICTVHIHMSKPDIIFSLNCFSVQWNSWIHIQDRVWGHRSQRKTLSIKPIGQGAIFIVRLVVDIPTLDTWTISIEMQASQSCVVERML